MPAWWPSCRNHNGRVDAGETDPNDPDSDNDLLPDGLEILFYGQALRPDPILDVVRQAGGIDIRFDSSNPFQLDPLDENSDGDGVDDGRDVFGRGSGLIGIEFDTFELFDYPDCTRNWWGKKNCEWGAEVVIDELDIQLPFYSESINVDLPDHSGGSYDAIPTIDNSYNPAQLPDNVVSKFQAKADTTVQNQITDVTGVFTPWGAEYDSSLNLMLINVPDLFNEPSTSDLDSKAIEIRLRLREADRSNGDDSIDLNPGSSRSLSGEALYFRLPLFPKRPGELNGDATLGSEITSQAGEKSGDTFRWSNAGWKYATGNDATGAGDGKIDGELKFRIGENSPSITQP